MGNAIAFLRHPHCCHLTPILSEPALESVPSSLPLPSHVFPAIIILPIATASVTRLFPNLLTSLRRPILPPLHCPVLPIATSCCLMHLATTASHRPHLWNLESWPLPLPAISSIDALGLAWRPEARYVVGLDLGSRLKSRAWAWHSAAVP